MSSKILYRPVNVRVKFPISYDTTYGWIIISVIKIEKGYRPICFSTPVIYFIIFVAAYSSQR